MQVNEKHNLSHLNSNQQKVQRMKCKAGIKNIVIGACLMAASGVIHAEDAMQNIAIPSLSSPYTMGSRSYMLALNEADTSPKQASATPAAQAAKFEPARFEPPMFSKSNAHKYLGLGTVAMVVATALAPKPAEIEGRPATRAELDAQKSSTHAKLGRAAATLAAATVVTGLFAHWNDFHLEDGWTDPDNMHVMLGSAGALAMLYAVSKAPEGGHAGAGIAGGAVMAVAIKLTW